MKNEQLNNAKSEEIFIEDIDGTVYRVFGQTDKDILCHLVAPEEGGSGLTFKPLECIPQDWFERIVAREQLVVVDGEVVALTEHQFDMAGRDNTYNNENDLSSQINWTIWTDEDSNDDWCYPRGRAFIALCIHQGGDVRGNYGACQVFEWEGADSGFLDYQLGWVVERCFDDEETTPHDIEDFDDEWATLIEALAKSDERLTERCSVGYSQCPSSELWNEVNSDRCYWFNGKAFLTDGDGEWLIATPYSYHGDVDIDLSGYKDDKNKGRLGYVCDASIDTESFIKSTLGEPIDGDAYPHLETLIDEVTSGWDHSEAVGRLCGMVEAIDNV